MYVFDVLTPLQFARWRAAEEDYPDDVARMLAQPNPGLSDGAAELAAWTGAREYATHQAELVDEVEQVSALAESGIDVTTFATAAPPVEVAMADQAHRAAVELFTRGWRNEDVFTVLYAGFLLHPDHACDIASAARERRPPWR